MLEFVVFHGHGIGRCESVRHVSVGPACSQRQDENWEHIAQTESSSPICDAFAGFQDSFSVKSPMRKSLHLN